MQACIVQEYIACAHDKHECPHVRVHGRERGHACADAPGPFPGWPAYSSSSSSRTGGLMSVRLVPG
eukprot:366051-Chlamydomonas_euryale.AAC.4